MCSQYLSGINCQNDERQSHGENSPGYQAEKG